MEIALKAYPVLRAIFNTIDKILCLAYNGAPKQKGSVPKTS